MSNNAWILITKRKLIQKIKNKKNYNQKGLIYMILYVLIKLYLTNEATKNGENWSKSNIFFIKFEKFHHIAQTLIELRDEYHIRMILMGKKNDGYERYIFESEMIR